MKNKTFDKGDSGTMRGKKKKKVCEGVRHKSAKKGGQ